MTRKEILENEKDCTNCKFSKIDPYELPCKNCRKCYSDPEQKRKDKPMPWEPKEVNPDMINHPPHYNFGKYECIDEMIHLFGVETVKHWCMCNVYKYRFRADHKNGEEDIKKAEWYMGKLMELQPKGVMCD